MKILLVKLSSLGDVVHTLPVVQDIRAAFPDAMIDWVVEKSFAPVLRHSEGLVRIIACEIRRWRKSPFSAQTRSAWRAFKAELQAEAYDAVIDLQGLTKSALVARLARLAPEGKRYAMANGTEGSGYEAATRWVADVAIPVPFHVHAVRRGRLLGAAALGYQPAEKISYGLTVPKAEGGDGATVLLVHGTSRQDKEWPATHWADLGRRLVGAGFHVALAHGNDGELSASQGTAADIVGATGRPGCAEVWPRLSLDALTARMARCAGVIGVDSGLSHIAVALDLAHVQIYNFDTAWRTGPLPHQEEDGGHAQASVFAQPAPSVEAVWSAWQACHAYQSGRVLAAATHEQVLP
ncbi:MAG: lipopolysaccharide heptosyltransferase I [Pseudomonadota bacterium]